MKNEECLYCDSGETHVEWPEGAAGIAMRALAIETHETDCEYADSLQREINDLLIESGDPDSAVNACIQFCQQVAQV